MKGCHTTMIPHAMSIAKQQSSSLRVAPNPKHFQREAHRVTARTMDMDQSEGGSKDTKNWIQHMCKKTGPRLRELVSDTRATYGQPYCFHLYMSAGMGTHARIFAADSESAMMSPSNIVRNHECFGVVNGFICYSCFDGCCNIWG